MMTRKRIFSSLVVIQSRKKSDKALEHLDLAVAFGFRDFDRIRTEGDLAFLRIQPEYTAFENNNFQRPKALPTPNEDVLDLQKPAFSDLLDQLARLEKERQAGLLSEEEYKDREKQLKSQRPDDDL